jgi:hypothetical protein
MTHIHWVERQNKLETPKEKDEVKKREVHECDVRTRDPDAMVPTWCHGVMVYGVWRQFSFFF